jgi:membrane associated rhomboid family serine protease
MEVHMLPLPFIDNLRCRTFPWATVIIIVLNALAFMVQMIAQSNGNGDWFQSTFALIPGNVTHAFQSADPYQIALGVMSIFTAMFMHGGIEHIAGNMMFLFVFGRGLESRLGFWRFVAFYLVCGFAAFGLQMWSDPMSMVPNVGASGAIAGVLGGYLLFFPQARIRGLIIVTSGPIPLPLPVGVRAFWFLLFWIIFQFEAVLPNLLHGTMSSSGGGVAYWAHIGGFIGGLALAAVLKWISPVSDDCYIPTNCGPCKDENHTHNEDEHKDQ